MRVIPISDILAMDHDDTVDSVVGQITKIWKRNAGNNSNGDWSLQNLTLRDQTGEIKVQLKDRDNLGPEWLNRTVSIFCNQGQRGKTGVKAKDDTYKGQTTRILSVTPTAHVELHEENAPAQPPPAPTVSQNRPAPTQPAPARQPAPPRSAPPQTTQAPARTQQTKPVSQPPKTPAPLKEIDSTRAVKMARKRLGQAANSMILCFAAAAYVREHVLARHGIDLTPAELEKLAVHFSITLDKEGVSGLLPSAPMIPKQGEQQA
jgi:hypothetical protein